MSQFGGVADHSFAYDGQTVTSDFFPVLYMSGNKTVSIANTTTARPVGTLQNRPDATSSAAHVRVFGPSKAVANLSITTGEFVGIATTGDTSTGGRVGSVTAFAALTATAWAYSVGYALEAAVTLQVFEVFINPQLYSQA